MQSIIESAVTMAEQHPVVLVVVGFVGLLVVGMPLAGLVRAYWAPKVVGWRRWAGQVCQRFGARLSGGPAASEQGAMPEVPTVPEEVRRVRERV